VRFGVLVGALFFATVGMASAAAIKGTPKTTSSKEPLRTT